MTFINGVPMSNAVGQKIVLDSGPLFWHWTKVTLLDGLISCTLAIIPSLKENNIPEIQNFDVVPPLRRRGVGSQLLDGIEPFAFRRYDVIGIRLGLYADYGMAQRLYVKRGYIPDGRGVMFHNQPSVPGILCLSMTTWYYSLSKANRIMVNIAATSVDSMRSPGNVISSFLSSHNSLVS